MYYNKFSLNIIQPSSSPQPDKYDILRDQMQFLIDNTGFTSDKNGLQKIDELVKEIENALDGHDHYGLNTVIMRQLGKRRLQISEVIAGKSHLTTRLRLIKLLHSPNN